MGRKIRMSLDLKSIEAAAEELRSYAKHLRESEAEIKHRLCTIAADEARDRFDDTIYIAETENGIMAMGESVVFQEYGAGSRISDPYPGGTDADIEIRRGAYSDLREGEYAQTGYQFWHHDGERYEYVTPVSGLFYGMMAAQEREAEVAKEALKKA